jgi:hypothetical protein
LIKRNLKMAQKQFIIDGGFNTNADSQITGNLSMTGSVLPTVDSDGVTGFDLGSPAAKWRDLYLSQGSLYIDGQKVLQSDSGTIVFKADADQGMTIRTEGSGVLTLQSPNPLAIAATLQMAAGKKITDASGTAVVFGDKIDADFNQIVNVGAPSANAHAATKYYVDEAISNLVNGAGAALDTLNELAAALGNDANFSTTISTQLATKATVVALDAEVTRATAAEGVNAAAISDEISARVTAISNEASARTSADATLSTAIANEVTRATAAESALQDDIDTRATQAALDAAVATLSTSVSSVIGDATTDELLEGSTNLWWNTTREAALQAYADQAEADAVATSQSSIASATSALQSYADTADQQILLDAAGYTDSEVSSEAAARASADTTNANAIAAEATARANADATLQGNITSEATARANGDSALQTQINNILSNTDATALNSLAELVAAFQAADSNLSTSISNLSSSAGSSIAALEARVAALEAKLALVTSVSGGIRVAGTVTATGDVTAFGA